MTDENGGFTTKARRARRAHKEEEGFTTEARRAGEYEEGNGSMAADRWKTSVGGHRSVEVEDVLSTDSAD